MSNFRALNGPYQRLPQGDIVVRTKGEHAGLDIPIRGPRVPVSSHTDIVGCDRHHACKDFRELRRPRRVGAGDCSWRRKELSQKIIVEEGLSIRMILPSPSPPPSSTFTFQQSSQETL